MSNFYNQASWVLVPSGIEEDIVFAQKPSSGLGDLVMTRASDATYTDSTGVVRRSPYNLFQFSEQFDDAYWGKLNITVTQNNSLSPSGTITADLLTPTGTGLLRRIYGTIASGTYTASIYLKSNTGSSFTTRLAFRDSVNNITQVENITVLTDWQRFNITFTTAGTTGFEFWIGGSGTLDTGKNLLAWGAQLVEGSAALDYFPTTNRQDVPRIDFRNADGTLSSCGRLLLEPQRTNSIRNSSMVGAVAGSPGTLPTNWTVTNGGLTQTITGVGTENGLPYIEVRFNGTATGAIAQIRHDAVNQITAANGQVWSYTFYAKVISQPSPPVTYSQVIFERTSAGSLIKSGSQLITPTANLQRFTFTRTLDGGATVGAVDPVFYCTLTIGQTYDFTIRIAAPQMELGAFATTWVPTTTAAVTRLADTASKTGVASLIGQTEGTIYAEVNFNKNTSGIIFAINDGTATNRIYIQFITSTALIANIRVAGVNLNFIATIPTIPATGGTYKVALAYRQNDYVFSLNGTNYISTDTRAVPATSRIDVGQSTGAGQLEGGVTQAILYPTRLDNATLAQMTTL